MTALARTLHRDSRGHWIQVLGGRVFSLSHPSPDDVDFRRDSQALAEIARFGGHADQGSYSVAQHCVLAAEIAKHLTRGWRCDDERRLIVLATLLHDFHEAYIGDVTSPRAREQAAIERRTITAILGRVPDDYVPALSILKTSVDAAIYAAAGIATPMPRRWTAIIDEADAIAMDTERADLMLDPPMPWWPGDVVGSRRWPHHVRPMPAVAAHAAWIESFDHLTKGVL